MWICDVTSNHVSLCNVIIYLIAKNIVCLLRTNSTRRKKSGRQSCQPFFLYCDWLSSRDTPNSCIVVGFIIIMNLFSSQYTKNSIKLIKIDNIKIKYKNNLNIIKIDLNIHEETTYKYSTYGTYIWNIDFADSTRA